MSSPVVIVQTDVESTSKRIWLADYLGRPPSNEELWSFTRLIKLLRLDNESAAKLIDEGYSW
jgi:hypothetical protein